MIEKIAFNLGRNDEEPNIALAIELSNSKDLKGIEEIVDGLKNKKEQVANDCIKVLYEIGERKPELIANYVLDFIQLLKSRNNRLVWGAMTAISKITVLKPKEVFENIEIIIDAYENGSVITRDNSISVFAELAKADKKYEKIMLTKIIQHLETCRPKEVGQHAERAFICINQENSNEFLSVLLKRRNNLSDSQKKRVDKLIKKINI
ncbi:hypothetical protein CLORY_03080 [Clostridium oryzae]|uniref:HEAT repeat protein n=2 Tax=Clostridium oryzae TaxID=1450648 RepID=A0A1V4IY19_9CLOT|nr:hypothetical protein CLORY_03080 [Clostridium oryzae]